MQKKRPIRLTLKDLKDLRLLVDFLNKAPARVGTGSTMGKMCDDATVKSYDRLHREMSHFLAPTADVPRNWPPAERKRETDLMNYYGPKIGLTIVLEELSRHAEKPRWQMVLNPKKVEPSKRPKFRPIIVRQEFHDPLWSALARLLETGDVYWIGRCLVCKKFFVKNRDWQEICPKPACRKTHERRLAADGQARRRGDEKRRREAKRIE